MGSHNFYADLFKDLPDNALYSPPDLVRFARETPRWEFYLAQGGHSQEYVEKKLVDALRKRMKRAFSEDQIVEFVSSYSRRNSKGVAGKDWKEEFGISSNECSAEASLPKDTTDLFENLEKRIEDFLNTQEEKLKVDDDSLRVKIPKSGKHLKIFEITDDLTMDSLVASNNIWKAKCEELQEENDFLRKNEGKERWLSGSRAKFAKPLFLVASFLFVLAIVAGISQPNLFDIHRTEGASAALAAVNQQAQKAPLADADLYAKAYFLYEMERISEAKALSNKLIASPTLKTKALGNHLAGLISWHNGDKKRAKIFFNKALDSDAITGNTRAIIMLHFGKKTKDYVMISESESYAVPSEDGYQSFQVEYARARLGIAGSLEEKKEWAIIGIERAVEGQFLQKEAYFRKDLAILQIALGENTIEHFLAQGIALDLNDRRIWLFSLIPEGMIAKREGDEIRYHWIVETLESELNSNSSALLRANIKSLKSWSP